MSANPTFGQRLSEATAARGPLCVGIDPHESLLDAWGLTRDVNGLERFAATCVEAFSSVAAVVKPQSAFFERFGSRGIAILERTLTSLRTGSTLSLLDVKRGDIGTTMAGYAQAYLDDESPLRADAITASPYLGYASLGPAIELAQATGRGVFVLALTSNPEGASVQHAVLDGVSVAASVARGASADNASALAAGHLGSVGLVVGATVGDAPERLGLDLAAVNGPILAPGYGAQGAGVDELRSVFAGATSNVLVAASRSILARGPSVTALRDAVEREADALRSIGP